MSNSDIYSYKYLDKNIAEKRKDSLLKFINGEQENNDLSFYDLDFYEREPNNKRIKIKNYLNRSQLDSNIILNSYQIELLSILQDHNLFLSAPTSFGKTYVILEFIKRNKDSLNNIVFIVPTLALMNELVKKIENSFSDEFNICINSNELIAEKNIFIFVPERTGDEFLSILKDNNIDIDFLVIDEIYKLKSTSSAKITVDDRLIGMNKVYLNMVKTAKKIALLGPFIKDVKFQNTKLDIVKYYTNFSPVYNEIKIEKKEKWLDLITDEKCLIYFNVPNNIYPFVKEFLKKIPANKKYNSYYHDEIKYLSENYGEGWYVIELLKRGYGIHHGKMPMFLRKFYENEYRNGKIKGLFCTSTLMEGINTPTNLLIIMEKARDAFSMNNLIGRVGRLSTERPQIGTIYICDENVEHDYTQSIDEWIELEILAERPKADNNEEALYLQKEEWNNEQKQKRYNRKLEAICSYSGKTKDYLSKQDVKFSKLYDFVDKDMRDKFQFVSDEKKCIDLSTELIGRNYYFFFKNTHLGTADGAPIYANKYLRMLLKGKSIKEIVDDFNTIANKNRETEKTNIFLDSLYELNNYIKFELIKLPNYFNVFDVDVSKNSFLNSICLSLSRYVEKDVTFKILDDLGVEKSDWTKIVKHIEKEEKTSVSKLIKTIRKNKDNIFKENINPFTKNNINNL